jgi:hypothetical protein
MVHPMLQPLTLEAQDRHPAKLSVSIMSTHLTELLDAAREADHLAKLGGSAIHGIAWRFQGTVSCHKRRSTKAWSMPGEHRTLYGFYAKGRAIASSVKNSLVYAKDKLYVHRQALLHQSNRMDDFAKLLERYHGYASFEMFQMEEATDLLYDTSWLNRFIRPDVDGVEQEGAHPDHPGTDDEFASESTDDDKETDTFGKLLGLGSDGNCSSNEKENHSHLAGTRRLLAGPASILVSDTLSSSRGY